MNCCTEGEIEQFLNVSERQSEESCRADLKVSCERSIAALRFSYDQKRVRFDNNILTLTASTTYTLTCMNTGGMAMQPVTITVQ